MNFLTVAFLCICCFFVGANLNTNSEKIEIMIDQIDQIGADISSIKEQTESIESDVSSIQSDVSSIESDVSTIESNIR